SPQGERAVGGGLPPLCPVRVVTILSVVLAAAAGMLYVVVIRDLPAPHGTERLPLWALTLLFTAAELLVVPQRFRRGAQGLSLSEIPLVIGLVTTAPAALVAARVLGSGLGLLFAQAQRGSKLAFNLSTMALEACLATVLFSTLVGAEPTLSPRGWAAVLVTVLVADALTAILVTTAIVGHDDRREWTRLPLVLLGGILPVVANTCFALLVLLAAKQNSLAGLLLTVVGAVGYVAYQRYAF
ncbi:MAG: hypothetical protein M3P96_00005, partial [Actinomycetota bacterium]|nr:hypothetical protein [Actinomycetota bacterium]